LDLFTGRGTWLVDVQAHTINEGGQLLLMTVDNSYHFSVYPHINMKSKKL